MAPYDEGTIVFLMTEIYTILQKLCYMDPSDISFPSLEGHPLNESLCASLNLSPAVISLIKRLPRPIDRETATDFDFIMESRPIDYTDDTDLLESRDPENAGTYFEHVRLEYLLPSDVALTVGRLHGISLVLDTQANTIRRVSLQSMPTETVIEIPEDRWHYRNFPAEPAEAVLRDYIREFKTLEWIPKRGIREFLQESEGYDQEYQHVKRVLVENYGWPDNFRDGEWARDYERVWFEADPSNRFQPL